QEEVFSTRQRFASSVISTPQTVTEILLKPGSDGSSLAPDAEDVMKSMAIVGLTCSLLVVAGAPARAHHSAAAFDTQQTVTITGSIRQYSFANPHIYIALQTKKDDGASAPVEVEAGAASVLNGLGFTKTAISVGEVVTIIGNPARKDPDKLILG